MSRPHDVNVVADESSGRVTDKFSKAKSLWFELAVGGGVGLPDPGNGQPPTLSKPTAARIATGDKIVVFPLEFASVLMM